MLICLHSRSLFHHFFDILIRCVDHIRISNSRDSALRWDGMRFGRDCIWDDISHLHFHAVLKYEFPFCGEIKIESLRRILEYPQKMRCSRNWGSNGCTFSLIYWIIMGNGCSIARYAERPMVQIRFWWCIQMHVKYLL